VVTTKFLLDHPQEHSKSQRVAVRTR
jgi:hypothetical protein